MVLNWMDKGLIGEGKGVDRGAVVFGVLDGGSGVDREAVRWNGELWLTSGWNGGW